MPQEFMVLRCFNCQMYQVHQVRKSKKWSCKMCNQKQSQFKIFVKGNGKECRELVQTLNMKKSEEIEPEIYKENCEDICCSVSHTKTKTWEKFEVAAEESNSSSDEDNTTFDSDKWTGSKSKKRRKISSETLNKTLRQNIQNTIGLRSHTATNYKIEETENMNSQKNKNLLTTEGWNEQSSQVVNSNYLSVEAAQTITDTIKQPKNVLSGKWAQYNTNAETVSSSSESD